MNHTKRAISDLEKQQRIQEIIDTAEGLLENSNYKDITMAKIAQEAGLAKGTLFIYFQTKEDLFLHLAEQAISHWSQEIQVKFGDLIKSTGHLSPNEFVDILINSVNNELLLKLFSILDDTLEQNIDLDRAFRFKTFLKKEMSEIGKLIEIVLPFVLEGHGIMLLSQLFICLVGAYKVSNPSPVVKQVIQKPGLQIFDRNFVKTMGDLATYHIYGYIAKHQRQ